MITDCNEQFLQKKLFDHEGHGIETSCARKKSGQRQGSVLVCQAGGDGGSGPHSIGGTWARSRIGDPIISCVMREVIFSNMTAMMDLLSSEMLDSAWRLRMTFSVNDEARGRGTQ
jgi:hypothetical protein